MVPTYSANPERDTPTFVKLVEKVKAEQTISAGTQKPESAEKKEDKGPWYTNTWVLIGGGAVVAGGVALLLLSGKKESEKVNPLPGPPGLP